MKKKVILSLIVIFVLVLSFGILTSCKKKTTEGDEIVITGIEMEEYPNQYYIVGETVEYDTGSIRVHRYNKTQNKTEDDIIVSMADKNVAYNKGGSAVANTYSITVQYAGFSTNYSYCVQEENNAIKSVEFDVKDYFTPLVYAKTENRPTYDYNDFSGLFITVKYRDESKSDVKYDLSSMFSFTSSDVVCTGFDATTVGKRDIVFSYNVSVFKVPYEIVDYDWVDGYKFVKKNTSGEYEEIDPIDYIKTNYLQGDEFDANGVEVVFIYNSLNEKEPVKIEASDVYNFSTEEVTTDSKKLIIYKTTPISDNSSTNYELTYSISYNVFDDIKNIRFVKTNKQLVVKTEDNADGYITCQDYLNSIDLKFITEDDTEIAVKAGDDRIIAYYALSGTTEKYQLTDATFNTLVTKGQLVDIYVAYKYNSEIEIKACKIEIENPISKIEINDWDTVKTSYTLGETFDFGTATYEVVYSDGTKKITVLQELYEDLSKNEIIKSYPKCTNVTEAFDMTESHNDKTSLRYYLDVSTQGKVYKDGELYTNDTGKLYISYTVE